VKYRFQDQELSLARVRAIARAACDALPNSSCVMSTDPERPQCTVKNCAMMKLLRRAFSFNTEVKQ
jgi:hypothetical protein